MVGTFVRRARCSILASVAVLGGGVDASAQTTATFTEDVALLSRLLGRDLGSWLSVMTGPGARSTAR